MESAVLEIIDYQPEHQPWFEKFNRHWIEKHFRMEPIDVEVLQHPESHILSKGGSILMATWQKELAGTVALKFVETGVYEFTKMAVEDRFQGKKIGRALAEAAIERAKKAGANRIILYSNTKLPTAIVLYRKLGFHEIPLDGPYQRSDIKMELDLRSPDIFRYRDATLEDLPRIVEIYNSTIAGRMVTADTEVVSVGSRLGWFHDHTGKRPLWVVLDQDEKIMGWVSFQSFYGRPAYDATAEISIYLDQLMRSRGLGKKVLEYAMASCSNLKIKTLLGFIFSHNEPSLKLFKHAGFQEWALLPNIAVLDGIDRSLVIMGKRIVQ
jgi:phosphinothricin acetyltransferase